MVHLYRSQLRWGALGAAGAALVAGAADAGLALEKERKFEATNETRDQAEFLPAELFTVNTDPNVMGDLPTVIVAGRGGGLDVDFFAFEMLEPGVLLVDIDNTPASFDAFVSVFNDRGALIGYSDNDADDRGSEQNDKDAFVGTLYLPEGGVYYIAVSSAENMPLLLSQRGGSLEEAEIQSVAPRVIPLVRPDGAPGGYAVVDAPDDSDDFGESGPLDALPYSVAISATGVDAPPASGIAGALAANLSDARLLFPTGNASRGFAIGGGGGGGGDGGGGGGGGDDGGDDGGGDPRDDPPPPGPDPEPIPLPGGGLMGLIGLGAVASRRRRPVS